MKNTGFLLFVFVLFAVLYAVPLRVYAGDCPGGDICGKLKAEEAARREILLRESLQRRQKGPSVKTAYPAPPKKNAAQKKTEKAIGSGKTKRTPVLNLRGRPASRVASTPVEVHPEKTVWISLSNRDVNRVVCTTGDIESVHYSTEKGIEVSVEGNQAFIKFRVLTNPQDPLGEVKYVTVPSEFFVVCGGETYGFIARPRNIPARTVYLVSSGARIKEVLDTFRRSDIDRALVAIVKPVFRDEIPPAWERVRKFDPARMRLLLPGPLKEDISVNVVEAERYLIPGLPVMVRVFAIKNPDEKNIVQVNERIFLDGLIVTNPVAVSILDHTLPPGVATRAVVVERLVAKGL